MSRAGKVSGPIFGKSGFDVITMWDVIEHVNFPLETLRSAWALLREGGHLFIDTPCRDSFFHRLGNFTHRMSAGRFPTLLNMLYSTEAYGHKQIISTRGIEALFRRSGFEMLHASKICELSSPCENYILKYSGSQSLARTLGPLARAFVGVTRVRNKMIVVGRKSHRQPDQN
jgi:2-polyprenyl-6-hydroxyphenyl methylase/3-demethylubiquinone-9 3-methyltransferase